MLAPCAPVAFANFAQAPRCIILITNETQSCHVTCWPLPPPHCQPIRQRLIELFGASRYSPKTAVGTGAWPATNTYRQPPRVMPFELPGGAPKESGVINWKAIDVSVNANVSLRARGAVSCAS